MKELDVNVIEEEQLENGDYLVTLEIPVWLDETLKEKYGKDDYSDEFSKDFCNWVREYIKNNEKV